MCTIPWTHYHKGYNRKRDAGFHPLPLMDAFRVSTAHGLLPTAAHITDVNQWARGRTQHVHQLVSSRAHQRVIRGVLGRGESCRTKVDDPENGAILARTG